jgi:sporulation protein YlmC with PRC-barrel domain
MKKMLLAGTAALCLFTGSAFAASHQTDVDPGESSGTVVTRDQIEMRALIGKKVIDGNGDAIGTVDNVLIDALGKVADTAVIQVGGIVGNGGKLITVPIAELKPSKDGKTLSIDGLTRQQAIDMKPEAGGDAVDNSSSAHTDQQEVALPSSTASAENPVEWEPRLLIGHEVVDSDGRKIGTVDNLLMNASGDRPAKVIIKSGGFLGLGAKLIAVDFATLRRGPNQTNNVLSPGVLIATGLTREKVRQMEDFRYDPAMRTYRPSGS